MAHYVYCNVIGESIYFAAEDSFTKMYSYWSVCVFHIQGYTDICDWFIKCKDQSELFRDVDWMKSDCRLCMCLNVMYSFVKNLILFF